MLKPGGLQVLGIFREGERAAALSVDQHVDGEQCAFAGPRAAGLHDHVADGDPPARHKAAYTLANSSRLCRREC